MDCTGRWTEKIVACRKTTTNCQIPTCFTGHDPFESVRRRVFRPQEGRARTGAYMVAYIERRYLAHATGLVHEKPNIRSQHVAYGRERGDNGTEPWIANLEWKEIEVEIPQTCGEAWAPRAYCEAYAIGIMGAKGST